MKRGELYRVYKSSQNDPRDHRVFLIVSRQLLLNSNFSTAICAPVYSDYKGIPTQVEIGTDEGLKHDSAVYCDDLKSIQKASLTDSVGTLSPSKTEEVNTAPRIALAIE